MLSTPMTNRKNIRWGIVLFMLLSLAGCIKGGTDFSDEENTIANTSHSTGESQDLEDSTESTTSTTTTSPSTTVIISQPSTSDEESFVDSVFPKYTVSSGGIQTSPIQIEFNRTMNVSSVNAAVSISGGSSFVQLTPLTTGETAQVFLFQPNESLQLSTIYVVSISAAARDILGNTMPAEDKWLIRIRNLSQSFSPDDSERFKIGDTMCCILGMELNAALDTRDLIVSGDGGIIRLKNNGSGTFTSSTIKSENSTAPFSALTRTDVDQDGLEDLVMMRDAGNDTAYIYSVFNQMDVNSSSPLIASTDTKVASVSQVFSPGNRIVSSDINNDGNIDLALTDQGGTQPRVLVLGGVGTGDFTVVYELLLNKNAMPSDLAFTDFNQDGNSDIAVLSTSGKTMILYTGDGNGIFSELTTGGFDSLFTSLIPNRFAVADFDGDRYPDFVISDLANDQIVYLSNQKDMTFKILSQVAVGRAPGAIAYGHFNSDRLLDVAVANVEDRDVSILLGDGTGGFTLQEDLAANGEVAEMTAGNLNGDSIDDLAVMSTDISGLSIYFGSDDGIFTANGNVNTGSSPSSVAAMDINEDSIVDLIVSNRDDSDLSILYGNGKNSFSRQSDIDLTSSAMPLEMIVGDFDNDHTNELVTVNEGDNTITLFVKKNGQLASLYSVSVTGDGLKNGVAGDFNNDGQLDLAMVMSNSDQITILYNTGGGFSDLNQNTISTPSKPVSIASGYFNSDDDLDLAVVNQNAKTISIYYGTGTGHFVLVQTISAPTNVQTTASIQLGEIIAITDEKKRVTVLAVIDQGIPVTTFSQQNNVFLYTNYNGTFLFITSLSVSAQPRHISAADLNDDAIPELIVTAPSLLAVFTDNGDRLYTAASTSVNLGSNPQRAVSADLNGDLAPDIVVVDQINDELSIFFQR
ncbi:MAG: VCBS repeat-containing protein [SAR324 cluster bacterium]|nr:VCBS repeat-containing protein [SAR324 cluster bacterium]